MSEKVIYFATRNPALKTRFQSRWRQHAALAMTLPPVWDDAVRLYVQYDVVARPPKVLGPAGYDGVGMVWLRSADDFEAADANEAMRIMERDERETFTVLVHETAYFCSEQVIKEGEEVFKVFSSVNGDSGPAEPAAVQAFARAVGADPELGPRLSRLSVCTPNGLTVHGGRKHDGLIEYSFFTLDDAEAFFSSAAFSAVSRAHPKVQEVDRFATRVGLRNDLDHYH